MSDKNDKSKYVHIEGKPEFVVVSNSEASESDVFSSKKQKSLFRWSNDSIEQRLIHSSNKSENSALKHEGEAQWTLQKQQEAYRESQ